MRTVGWWRVPGAVACDRTPRGVLFHRADRNGGSPGFVFRHLPHSQRSSRKAPRREGCDCGRCDQCGIGRPRHADRLQFCGANPVVIGTLVVLGNAAVRLSAEHDIPVESIAQLPGNLWAPSKCPLCASETPLENAMDEARPD